MGTVPEIIAFLSETLHHFNGQPHSKNTAALRAAALRAAAIPIMQELHRASERVYSQNPNAHHRVSGFLHTLQSAEDAKDGGSLFADFSTFLADVKRLIGSTEQAVKSEERKECPHGFFRTL